MNQKNRRGFTAAEKAELWDRYQVRNKEQR